MSLVRYVNASQSEVKNRRTGMMTKRAKENPTTANQPAPFPPQPAARTHWQSNTTWKPLGPPKLAPVINSAPTTEP